MFSLFLGTYIPVEKEVEHLAALEEADHVLVLLKGAVLDPEREKDLGHQNIVPEEVDVTRAV